MAEWLHVDFRGVAISEDPGSIPERDNVEKEFFYIVSPLSVCSIIVVPINFHNTSALVSTLCCFNSSVCCVAKKIQINVVTGNEICFL